jgi:hypothetical protein
MIRQYRLDVWLTTVVAATLLLALLFKPRLGWFVARSISRVRSRHVVRIDLAERKDRPFLAIWQRSGGYRMDDSGPYLRVAIWDDGKVLFAKEPSQWSHDLRRGQISGDRIARLKEDLVRTGVFDLEGTCYLVPDAPVDCVMIDFSGESQMLYWDEREIAGYGINVNPTWRHLDFIACWKAINKLALGALPAQSEPVTGEFRQPASWIIKEAIQSE